jgi:hypothetical protein
MTILPSSISIVAERAGKTGISINSQNGLII